MSNNTVTLSSEIKRVFRIIDFKVMSTIFTLLGVAFGTILMVLFTSSGLPPNGLVGIIFPTYGITLFVSGICIGTLTGTACTIALIRYSKLKVKPYVDAPHEIESVKDGLIALGAFVTTIENTINAKKVAHIFYNISKRFRKVESRVERLEENEVYYHRIIAEQKRTIFDLKEINKKQDELIKQFQSKESVKEQQIGDNIHAQDINENTKINDENKKFEPKD